MFWFNKKHDLKVMKNSIHAVFLVFSKRKEVAGAGIRAELITRAGRIRRPHAPQCA